MPLKYRMTHRLIPINKRYGNLKFYKNEESLVFFQLSRFINLKPYKVHIVRIAEEEE